MSPRAYRLGARAAAVTETRERTVRAARELLAGGGFHRTALEDVANRADVSRATVYHQFGSKTGLLEAVLADFEQRAGLASLTHLVHEVSPERLVRQVVTAGCRYWATDPDLCRKILGLSTTDPTMHDLLAAHNRGRLSLLTTMVQRLSVAGLLRPGLGKERAVDALWLVTSFDAYDLLAHGRNRSTTSVARTLAELAELQVQGPPSDRS